jgi:hypothetical protein
LLADQGDDPACQGNWFQDVVQTKLPFGYQTFGANVLGWNKMYVDQSRIVGFKLVRLSYPISGLNAVEWYAAEWFAAEWSAERKE